jgi:hypothetical protein
MRTHMIVGTALFTAGLLVGCADASDGADAGAEDGPVAEQSAALTMAASMTWAAPAHVTLSLIPGTDSDSSIDAAPGSHEVYQVEVTPQPNTQNGQVTVSRFWDGASEASCASRSLSTRVLRTSATGGIAIYSEILEIDVPSTYDAGSGEFPQPGCRAKASVAFSSTTTKLRVMAQARTRTLVFGGAPIYTNNAVTVAAKGTSPAPNLTASMTIASDGAANAFVINSGNVTAPSVDADITYKYKFCPPPSGLESPICELSGISSCQGSFCPPGAFSWPFGPVRKAVSCSWTKDFPQVSIGANGGVLNWVWHQAGVEAGCGLCDPDSANCANVSASVTAKSTVAPYSSMTAAFDSDTADWLD